MAATLFGSIKRVPNLRELALSNEQFDISGSEPVFQKQSMQAPESQDTDSSSETSFNSSSRGFGMKGLC